MSSPQPGNVLIADGDAAIRSLLAAIVIRLGRTPLMAADGARALTLLREHPVEALILDLWLPDLGGDALLRRIEASMPSALPRTIVVTTAIPTTALSSPVGAILRKPFPLDELMSALRRCFQQQPG